MELFTLVMDHCLDLELPRNTLFRVLAKTSQHPDRENLT